MNNVSKIGRPKKENPLSETITFKMNSDDRDKYNKIAKLCGVGLADVIRFALSEEYKREDGFIKLRANLKNIKL